MSPKTQPVVAVLVAAGSGSRLGAAVPKALVEVDGVALVRRAADALVAGGVERLAVTVPAEWAASFDDALGGISVPVRCLPGGETRQDSVRIGLTAFDDVPAEAIVLVHDAARALVRAETVAAVAGAVADGAEAVVPVLPVVDSIRRLDGQGSTVVDRAPLRAVQTPQGARLGVLRRAHERALAEGVEATDDAAVCEHSGIAVSLVPGHRDAIKVTEPIDLVIAHAIVAGRNAE